MVWISVKAAHTFATFRTEKKISQLLWPHTQGVGYVTLLSQLESESVESLPSQLSDSSSWDSVISMGVVFKKLFANITSTSQAEQHEDIEPFDADPWA